MFAHPFKGLLLAATIVGTAGPALSEDLTPPAAEDVVLASPTSSLGTPDILITVLALLLVWAAVEQKEESERR
ncbi:hypothetical protein [Yoonia litorea]|uniref:VPEID-CTERM protein sorting domain-containing protein n=1 Tax=Yoonia litorea TaxID=1123755 RepID=A0A1I6LFA4_9RHOB|nr:hypothetical protein [Yoonia litorea]SFS02116.1 hypothetical protein SAMN05444714_0487 [Yoonia litorea]